MLISLKKTHKFEWFSFQKTYILPVAVALSIVLSLSIREVVSSSPARAGRVKPKTFKIGSDCSFAKSKAFSQEHSIQKCLFVCLFVLSCTTNFSAIWRLSPLPVTGLQIWTYALHLRHLALRVLLLATPTATRDLRF
jgi:hypothetical protein